MLHRLPSRYPPKRRMFQKASAPKSQKAKVQFAGTSCVPRTPKRVHLRPAKRTSAARETWRRALPRCRGLRRIARTRSPPGTGSACGHRCSRWHSPFPRSSGPDAGPCSSRPSRGSPRPPLPSISRTPSPSASPSRCSQTWPRWSTGSRSNAAETGGTNADRLR